MAGYCRQCSIDIFGIDRHDFSGLITETQFEAEGLAPLVLCESCGPIQVNHEGSCISDDCNIDHLIQLLERHEENLRAVSEYESEKKDE